MNSSGRRCVLRCARHPPVPNLVIPAAGRPHQKWPPAWHGLRGVQVEHLAIRMLSYLANQASTTPVGQMAAALTAPVRRQLGMDLSQCIALRSLRR